MMGLFQINQQGAGRRDPERECVDGKAFQGIHSELALEFFY